MQSGYPSGMVTHIDRCVRISPADKARLRLLFLAKHAQASGAPDAVMTGVETRTSSPVRITRGKDFQSLNVAGLYPAGEGAGYAGGILSAAIDGIKVAEAAALGMADAAA